MKKCMKNSTSVLRMKKMHVEFHLSFEDEEKCMKNSTSVLRMKKNA